MSKFFDSTGTQQMMTLIKSFMASYGKGLPYGVCSTASDTANKTVSISGFSLSVGSVVVVLFTNGFMNSHSYLNVSGTGAKMIYYKGGAVDPSRILDNTIALLRYDGSFWHIISMDSGAQNDEIAVDLGLPSGLKWAACNVGAKHPWDYGLYFQWGNVNGLTTSAPDYSTTVGGALYNSLSGAASSNFILPENDTYDAARANLGSPWRMPNAWEVDELISNCTFNYNIINGVYGRVLISKNNGKYLFFPFGGVILNNSSSTCP